MKTYINSDVIIKTVTQRLSECSGTQTSRFDNNQYAVKSMSNNLVHCALEIDNDDVYFTITSALFKECRYKVGVNRKSYITINHQMCMIAGL